MIVDLTSLQDVEKYYKGTYIICPEVDPHTPLYVKRTTPGGVEVQINSMGETSFIDVTEQPYEIKSPLSNRRQWFQLSDMHAALLVRIPARMWKKGVHEENTALFALGEKALGTSQLGVSFDMLRAFLMGGFLTEWPKETEFASAALSKDFAWVRKSNDIYFREHPIGRVSAKKDKLNLLKEFKDVELPPLLKDMSCVLI